MLSKIFIRCKKGLILNPKIAEGIKAANFQGPSLSPLLSAILYPGVNNVSYFKPENLAEKARE